MHQKTPGLGQNQWQPRYATIRDSDRDSIRAFNICAEPI